MRGGKLALAPELIGKEQLEGMFLRFGADVAREKKGEG